VTFGFIDFVRPKCLQTKSLALRFLPLSSLESHKIRKGKFAGEFCVFKCTGRRPRLEYYNGVGRLGEIGYKKEASEKSAQISE
jgi:hypothetical protein